MTGMEFRAIRMYNQVSQMDFAYNVGLRNRHSVQKLERREQVPPKYVKVLSQMIGLDFLDEKVFREHYEEIPETYKRINYTETPPFYANATISYPQAMIDRMTEKEKENFKKWNTKIISY
jgi:DNA-binding XRE family transcriptional regulator